MTMPALHKNRLFLALVILLAITLLAWLMPFSGQLTPRASGAVLLCMAFLKAHLIIGQYMELGSAWRPVRLAFHAWLLLTAGMTLGLYLR